MSLASHGEQLLFGPVHGLSVYRHSVIVWFYGAIIDCRVIYFTIPLLPEGEYIAYFRLGIPCVSMVAIVQSDLPLARLIGNKSPFTSRHWQLQPVTNLLKANAGMGTGYLGVTEIKFKKAVESGIGQR